MPGKCKFQETWLQKKDYKDWLKRRNNPYTAMCSLCLKTLQLGSMGEAIIRQHAKGSKHQNLIKQRRQVAVTIDDFNDSSSQSGFSSSSSEACDIAQSNSIPTQL